MSRRRSGRLAQADDDGDITMNGVEEGQDKGQAQPSVMKDSTDDEDEDEDEEAVDAEVAEVEEGGSESGKFDDALGEAAVQAEGSNLGHVNDMADTSMTTAGTVDDNDYNEDDKDQAPAAADTSTGSARPTRRAAQEATKKMVAAKAKVDKMIDDEDNDEEEDDAEPITKKDKRSKGKGKAKPQARVVDDGSDDEEEEVEQKTKKSKSKGKGKGKGKGKAIKDEPSSDESDFEQDNPNLAPGKEEGKKKKVVLAQAVYWKDIPKWEKGSGSLLMEMPAEIMDNIFGLREELGLAEYVALAGVCKVFRHFLNDKFFQGICVAKGYKAKGYYNADTDSWFHPPSPDSTPTPINTPFSRDIKDWRAPPPRKYTYTGTTKSLRTAATEVKTTHYVPKGDRHTWSKAQYTVYKEEKRASRDVKWVKRKVQLDEMIQEINKKAKGGVSHIRDGNMNRSVRGMVLGRKHGQPAVEKDDKGLPIVEKIEKDEDESSDDDEDSESINEEKRSAAKARKDDTAESSAGPQTVKVGLAQYINDPEDAQSDAHKQVDESRKRHYVSDSEEEDIENSAQKNSEPKPMKKGKTGGANKKKKQSTSKGWIVPDSSDESEDEMEYMRKQGVKVVHDYWPSEWRSTSANEVNNERINKTSAIKTFKVTEAQLLTLKHYLVHNAMSSKQPAQLYHKVAVQALALRAHGGIAKHGEIVAQANAKSEERAQKRRKSIMEAKRNGTYVHKKKSRSVPPWAYYLDWDDDDDYGYCDCGDCDY